MVAIEADLMAMNMTPEQHLQPFFDDHSDLKLDIACYNGPNNYVVAGKTEDVHVLAAYLKTQQQQFKAVCTRYPGGKLRFKVLNGMHAYHSRLADSIVDECASLSASIPLRTPTLPFESCHRGRKIRQDQADNQTIEPWSGPDSRARFDFIASNTRGPVYFGEAIQRIVARVGKPCTFLEAGIGSPIIAMAQNALTTGAVPTQDTYCDVEHTFIPISGTDPQRSLAEAIAMLHKTGTVTAQFWPFHRSQQRSFLTPQCRFVELPPYQFEKHCHWLDYSSHTLDALDSTPNIDPQGGLAGDFTHEAGAPDVCPSCYKSITDSPYIVPDKSTGDSTSEPRFTFILNTRNARYQELVSGHAVVGTPICPAAMYLEAAAQALLLLQSKDRQTPVGTDILCNFVIEDLEIRAPLGLETGGQRTLKLALCKDRNKQDTWRFKLFSSAKSNQKDVHIVHSVGAVTPLPSLNGLCEEIKEDGRQLWSRAFDLLHSDPETDAIRGAMVYKLFAPMVRYSDAYKLLHYLAARGPECAGEIAVPKGDESLAEVLLVDNFLQAAGAYMHSLRSPSDADNQGKTESMTYICTGMGTVAALGQLSGGTQYRAYTRLVREDDKNAILDIFAFRYGDRKLVWCAKGLRFTRILRSSLVKSLAPVSCASNQEKQGPVAILASVNGHNAGNNNNTSSSSSNSSKEEDVFSGVQAVLSNSVDIPAAEITREASLEELGIDSLVSPEILSAIVERFEVEITVPDFAGIPDVTSLCEKIIDQGQSQRMGSQATPNPSFHPVAESVMEVLSKSLDLARDEIDMASRLEDLGVDSLVAPEIISNLKTVLNVDISVVDFPEIVDVAALCQLARDPPSTTMSVSPPPAHGPVEPEPQSSEYLHKAFLQVRRRFDSYATAIGFTGFWEKVYPQQLLGVVAFIVEAFDKLGCRIQSYAPGQRLPTIDGILPKYQREMSRLWQILIEAGFVEQDTALGSYIRGPAHIDDNNKNGAWKQSTKLITDFPMCSAAHGLLTHLGPHLAECLTGEVNPVSLLFGTEQGQQLLDSFYRDAPEFQAASRVLGDFLSSAIYSHASKSSASPSDPLHVIEIGAGTGGTTKHLVPLLQATGLPFRYTFTDISSSLVARARKSTFKDATNMEFLKLDITQPTPIHLQGRYHVVISANCIHATPDITQSLANAYKLVRDGEGCVALLELTQRLPWYDLVWGLLDGWWLFNDGRDYPLQAPWVWEAAMQNAGFGHVDWSESRSRESRSTSVIVGFMTPQVKSKQQPLLEENTQQGRRALKQTCTACVSSLLVHRGSSPNAPNLFLVPGGRGLGSIYRPFGKYLVDSGISLSVSIYALSSPASMRTPKAGSKSDIITLEEHASACIAEIKRRQPQGPYMIGGWSFGGIVSYEMARQLQEAGDEVTKLVLIDTACPTRPTWYPDIVIEFIFSTLPPELKLGLQSDNLEASKKEARCRAKSLGSFPGEENSDDDFDFSVSLDDSGIAAARIQIENYRSSPLCVRKRPSTILVSARRGMVTGGKDVRELGLEPDMQWIANWLSNDRDEGPLGWDQLMGAENVTVIRADSDHYSIVQMPPGVSCFSLSLLSTDTNI
jgi:acyl carrier protein/SAM-dependent methyltransferase